MNIQYQGSYPSANQGNKTPGYNQITPYAQSQNMTQPQIITVNQSSGSMCGYCGRNTQSLASKRLGIAGAVTVIALIFVFPILSCVPCCCDGCKDT
jgi:hypothetical protein